MIRQVAAGELPQCFYRNEEKGRYSRLFAWRRRRVPMTWRTTIGSICLKVHMASHYKLTRILYLCTELPHLLHGLSQFSSELSTHKSSLGKSGSSVERESRARERERESSLTMASRVSTCFSVFVYSLLLLSSIAAVSATEGEHVLTLDHSNFSEVVSKSNFIVVEFYAPW